MEQYYSVYLYNKWNQCPRILEINRLDGLQLWRKQAYRDISKLYLNEQGKALYPEDFSCFLEEELRSIRRCDYYLCGNDFLFYLLTKKLKTKNASISSFGYPMIDFQNEASQLEYRPFKSRKNFVYVGNFIKEETLDDVAVLIS